MKCLLMKKEKKNLKDQPKPLDPEKKSRKKSLRNLPDHLVKNNQKSLEKRLKNSLRQHLQKKRKILKMEIILVSLPMSLLQRLVSL